MKHKIKTIQDIIDVVTEDNIDNFMKDFRGFIDAYIAMKGFSDAAVGTDVPMSVATLTWIDDNEHKINITLIPKEDE